MAEIGTLQNLIQDSDEEQDDIFHPETGLFSAAEANRPILDFSDSGSDSDDDLATSMTERFREPIVHEPIETSLNFVLGEENSQPTLPTDTSSNPSTSQTMQASNIDVQKPKKVINSLEDVFDPANFKTYETPLECKEYKTKLNTDGPNTPIINVNWTNQFNLSAPGRKRAKNIPDGQCGVPIGIAKEARTPVDAWSLFFDQRVMKLIVKHTNNNIKEKLLELKEKTANSSKYPFLKLTNELEIKALFGLLYYRGALGLSKVKASRLFEKKARPPHFWGYHE